MPMHFHLSNSYTFSFFPHFSFHKSPCWCLLTLTLILHFNIVCISYVCCLFSSIPIYSSRFSFLFMFFLILLRCGLYYPLSFIPSTTFQTHHHLLILFSRFKSLTNLFFSSQLDFFFSSSSSSYSFPYYLFLSFFILLLSLPRASKYYHLSLLRLQFLPHTPTFSPPPRPRPRPPPSPPPLPRHRARPPRPRPPPTLPSAHSPTPLPSARLQPAQPTRSIIVSSSVALQLRWWLSLMSH